MLPRSFELIFPRHVAKTMKFLPMVEEPPDLHMLSNVLQIR